VIEKLQALGLVRESEGALVAFLDDEKLPPCIVRKSDGGYNYATTDLATVFSREAEFHPDAIIYVTDERQQLHFRQFFAVAQKAGAKTHLRHIWFGLMRLPEGLLSTRKGTAIKLDLLLDEAERRALDLVKQASPDMPKEQQPPSPAPSASAPSSTPTSPRIPSPPSPSRGKRPSPWTATPPPISSTPAPASPP
jgi:arginyl-tRNA synthetase